MQRRDQRLEQSVRRGDHLRRRLISLLELRQRRCLFIEIDARYRLLLRLILIE